MNTPQQLRDLLGPADPAQRMALVEPTLSAGQVIARAERGDPSPSRPRATRSRRRAVLVAAPAFAAVLLAGSVAVVLGRPSADPNVLPLPPQAGPAVAGTVLTPISYEIRDAAPDAAPALRNLAASITAADHDAKSDGYVYHHLRSWGATRALGPDNRQMGLAREAWTWSDSRGTGESRVRDLQPEFPDEESRRYWESILASSGANSGSAGPVVASSGAVGAREPLDPGDLASMLRTDSGAPAVAKAVNELYRVHVVPLAIRSKIIETLADVQGFQWRGAVTDRAGRQGVAVTTDDRQHGFQMVLVFDPRTGDLLAHENVRLATPQQVVAYNLFLEYDRRSSIG
ncbi:CU044_5270 family protein [Micromonospora sp. NBC_01739]|uniref:CU044_5270 family protein n=1 Tax=Micromonospora sp. NBC_01739 TaxID=2975985 RepID=UPI002E117C54|nr:CU044_5270 family protein [Micromonospora sp. NBC_01739]